MALIKAGDTRKEFSLLCTHDHPEFVGFEVSDFYEVEKQTISDEDYIRYCLDMCNKYHVSLFLPSKKIMVIANHHEFFEKQGIKILSCASFDNLEILNHKAMLYNALCNDNIEIPEYYLVNTLDAFDEAYEVLSSKNKRVCFKPARSIYALGFKMIKHNINEMNAFLSSDVISVSLKEARHKFSQADFFQDVLVMEYLDGTEYSIDCLAKHGRLIRCTVRKKPSHVNGAQILEYNPELVHMAEQLTQRFELTGLFNIQTKSANGISKLLEINTRMSGGIYFSCLSGINYPYWGMRLAMEECESEIPDQTYGLKVNQVYMPFLVKNKS